MKFIFVGIGVRMDIWKKSDWREKPRVQMPDYQNTKVLHDVEAQLSKYPPLVFAGEARSLKRQLGDVANGKGFCCKVVIVQKVLRNLAQII